MAVPIVEIPVLKMQVGDFIVTKRTVNGLFAAKWEEVTKIEPSRRLNWFKVNDKFIYYPGAFFEAPFFAGNRFELPPGYDALLDKEVTLIPAQ